MMHKNYAVPELLSPAGNFEKLRTAIHFGADAVYFAAERFGMRAASDNFSQNELNRAIEYCHRLGKKAYITVNIMPRENEFQDLSAFLLSLNECPPDALIVADLGVFQLCRRLVPNIPLHISTQAATVNSYSCNAWYDMGAKRVVLARELSLREIENIRKNIPDDLELETFVHGSMCISFSGRCMLSEYFTKRDANRGACTQPCRWQYRFYEEKRTDDVLTGEVWPEGSYIFGSKDLCMIEHLNDLKNCGIDSFKIEGRIKSVMYAAVVTNSYRIALDELEHPKTSTSELLKDLCSVSHREFCTGYYFDPEMENSNIATHNGYLSEQAFLCSVTDYDSETGIATCKQRNKFTLGDECILFTPGKTGKKIKILNMLDEFNHEIDSCPHPQMVFKIKTDTLLKIGDFICKK